MYYISEIQKTLEQKHQYHNQEIDILKVQVNNGATTLFSQLSHFDSVSPCSKPHSWAGSFEIGQLDNVTRF